MIPFSTFTSKYIIKDLARDQKRARFEFWQDNPVASGKTTPDFLSRNKELPTAGYYDIFIPVQKLIKIQPEKMGFDPRLSDEKLKQVIIWLEKEGMNGLKQSPPLIIVDYTGTPKVREGTHRIKAAVKLGFNSIPVWIEYLGGSELLPKTFDPINFL